MIDIHIPPAAFEAGARAICEMEYGACDGGGPAECNCTYWMAHARAAFEAMVAAWPGMVNGSTRWPHRREIILPLAQTQDDRDGK